MKFEKIIPHVAIYFILLLAAFLYFKPVAFDGKSLGEQDNIQARGMQAEAQKYLKAENKVINWTNQVFLGMPTYQIFGNFTHNMIVRFCHLVFMFSMPINTPHTVLFFMMIFAYFGFLAMGVDKWISLLGALSFGFTANNMDLFQAGHSTKIHAMVYMAPIIAGTILAYRGKIILGGAMARARASRAPSWLAATW